LHAEDLGLSVEISSSPSPLIFTSDRRGIIGDDIERGTLHLEESITLAISKKLATPDGKHRRPPRIRPCHLIIYPNHDFGQDLHTAINRFHMRPPIEVASHFDQVWISDDSCVARLL
jgi:hypothetical protein